MIRAEERRGLRVMSGRVDGLVSKAGRSGSVGTCDKTEGAVVLTTGAAKEDWLSH